MIDLSKPHLVEAEVRRLITEEHLAIAHYDQIVNELPIDFPNRNKIVAVLASIRDEEKVHLAELHTLLEFAPENVSTFEQGKKEATELMAKLDNVDESSKPKVSPVEALNRFGERLDNIHLPKK